MALGIGDREHAGLLGVLDGQLARDLGEDRLALGLAGLEELGDTRETVGDVLTRDATGVERTHGELRARLADRLGGDDADRGADVDGTAAREVPAVASLADAVLRVAGHDRTADDLLDACVSKLASDLVGGDVVTGLDEDLAGLGIDGRLEQAAADEVVIDGVVVLEDAGTRQPRRCRSRARGR